MKRRPRTRASEGPAQKLRSLFRRVLGPKDRRARAADEPTPLEAQEHAREAKETFTRSFEDPYFERDSWRAPSVPPGEAHEHPRGEHPERFGQVSHASHAGEDFARRPEEWERDKGGKDRG